MKKILYLFLCVLSCFSCGNSNLIMDGDFISVYKKAQVENKKLWVIFGGGKRCKSCNNIIQEMIKDGVIKKYRNEYIFYKCNIEEPSNKFIQYILLMEQIPNSYIFDKKGKLIYASASGENLRSIKLSLKIGLADGLYHYPQNQFATKQSHKLLEMLNYAIDANISYINKQDDFTSIDSSIATEPYFYNLYLKYKMLQQKGDTLLADNCKRVAKEYFKTGWQAIVYDKLYKELDYSINSDSISVAKLSLNSHIVDVGTLKNNIRDTIYINFKNNGNKPLIVYYVSTDCSCIKTNFSKKPIMPNEESAVELVYEPSVKGDFIKKITVQSNAINNLEKVNIKGTVR